jgi:hypothetical protein
MAMSEDLFWRRVDALDLLLARAGVLGADGTVARSRGMTVPGLVGMGLTAARATGILWCGIGEFRSLATWVAEKTEHEVGLLARALSAGADARSLDVLGRAFYPLHELVAIRPRATRGPWTDLPYAALAAQVFASENKAGAAREELFGAAAEAARRRLPVGAVRAVIPGMCPKMDAAGGAGLVADWERARPRTVPRQVGWDECVRELGLARFDASEAGRRAALPPGHPDRLGIEQIQVMQAFAAAG